MIQLKMNWFFGDQTKENAQEIQSIISRISTSSLIEDRKEAVEKIFEFSNDENFKKSFGEESIKVMFEEMIKDHQDEDIVKKLLTIILNLSNVTL